VSLVDLAILAFVGLSVLHGLWLGAAVQVLSYGGFVAGLLIGSLVAPVVADQVADPGLSRLITLVVVLGAAGLVGSLGRVVGTKVWGTLRRLRLRRVDAALGAVLAATAALAVSWLLGTMLASIPRPGLAEELQRSEVLRRLDAALPPAPLVVARVQGLLQDRGLPPVFVGLPPAPAERLPPPSDPEVRQAFERAAGATLLVLGTGCPGIQQGSSFVAGTDLVVTNAHVIAGTDRITVTVDGRPRPAVPVRFDPDTDIAVLRVDGLGVDPLPLALAEVDRGARGAAVGYPLGGPVHGEAAVVLRRMDAAGRDIYHRGVVRRPVYEVQAHIRPGNSGGPLVDPDGQVIGLVFSRSAAADDVGYAVTAAPVAAHLEAARTITGAVDTGSCRSR
jgi:S1-C subfamily serine protease